MIWGTEFHAGNAHEKECIASKNAHVAGRMFENFSARV